MEEAKSFSIVTHWSVSQGKYSWYLGADILGADIGKLEKTIILRNCIRRKENLQNS